MFFAIRRWVWNNSSIATTLNKNGTFNAIALKGRLEAHYLSAIPGRVLHHIA